MVNYNEETDHINPGLLLLLYQGGKSACRLIGYNSDYEPRAEKARGFFMRCDGSEGSWIKD